MKDAKTFLQQVELLDTHINAKIEELERLNSLAVKTTSTLKQVAVFSPGVQDKVGDAVSKIVDLKNDINDTIDSYVDKKKQINEVLDLVENPDELAVLYMRYFEFKTFEQIACELHCTYRNVCYIHGRALQTVDKIRQKGGTKDVQKKL